MWRQSYLKYGVPHTPHCGLAKYKASRLLRICIGRYECRRGGGAGDRFQKTLASPVQLGDCAMPREDDAKVDTLDERVTRLRELRTQREQIESEMTSLQKELEGELSELLGFIQPTGAPSKTDKRKASRKCSICGLSGHNAATCASKSARTPEGKKARGGKDKKPR